MERKLNRDSCGVLTNSVLVSKRPEEWNTCFNCQKELPFKRRRGMIRTCSEKCGYARKIKKTNESSRRWLSRKTPEQKLVWKKKISEYQRKYYAEKSEYKKEYYQKNRVRLASLRIRKCSVCREETSGELKKTILCSPKCAEIFKRIYFHIKRVC